MVKTIETQKDPTATFGQYATDAFTGQALHDPFATLEARGDGNPAFHTDGLWDEEDTSNPNPVDGKTDQLPDEIEDNDLVEIAISSDLGQRALDVAMGMDDDPAARWLAEHDPNHS